MNQLATIETGKLRDKGQPGNAHRYLAELCTKYSLPGAVVYSKSKISDDLGWQMKLSVSLFAKRIHFGVLDDVSKHLDHVYWGTNLPFLVSESSDNGTIEKLLFIPLRDLKHESIVCVCPYGKFNRFFDIISFCLLIEMMCEDPDKSSVEKSDEAMNSLNGLERDVLRLRCDGLGLDQVAARLTLSPHIIQQIMKSIVSKLDCPDAVSAVAKAIKLNIV